MLSARQLLLMRGARDRAIDIDIAPLGTVVLLPDPDFRRRVFRCVSHVGLAFVARWVGRMDRVASVGGPIMVVGVVMLCGGCPAFKETPPLHAGPCLRKVAYRFKFVSRFACCARAASGHAAAPPARVMNSRLF